MPRNIYPEGVQPNLNSDLPLDSLRKIVQICGGQPELFDDIQRTWQKYNAALLASHLPDLIVNGVTQSGLINVSSNQTDYLNRLASITVYDLTCAAGSGPYTEQLILPTTGYERGNLIIVVIDLPASTNLTVQAQDEASGLQLLGSGQTSSGTAETHTLVFRFNGLNHRLIMWL